MTCKGAGGSKAKYLYYHINKYFYPILAEKKNDETKEIEQEIKKYQQQKDRLMEAYKAGILKMEDFAEDYKVIENKLSILENKRLDALDLDKESYNPQNIMAERDIEREKLTDGQMYKNILLNLWTMKTKEEKQKGRNQDINVKDMAGYKAIKNNYEKFNLKLKKANEKTNNVYTSSNKVKKMLENLKPTLMNKNNSLISKEKVEEIINLIDEVQDTT